MTAADVHDAWTAWFQPVNPAHAALVPFDELSPATQQLDEPYAHAIRSAFQAKDARARRPR